MRVELQRRIDNQMLRAAPWVGLVGCLCTSADLARFRSTDSHPLLLGVYAVLLASAWLAWAWFTSRATAASPHAQFMLGLLLLAGSVNGVARLHATHDPWYVGGLLILMMVTSVLVTKPAWFVATAGVAIAGGLPVVLAIDSPERVGRVVALLVAFLAGLSIASWRRDCQQYVAAVEDDDARHQRDLGETVDRLQAEVRVRQSSEAELRASEERYRKLFDNALVGMFQCSLSGRFLLANAALARMLGYDDPTDIVRAKLTDHLAIGGGSILPASPDALSTLVEHREEAVLACLDGTTRIVALHVRATAACVDGAAGYEGLVLDISERRAAEDALQQHRERLEHMSQLASFGETLAAVAHELHQPLHVIANLASASAYTLRDAAQPDLATLTRWNTTIADQAARAGEIIRGLRRIAKRGAPLRNVIELPQLVEESLSLMKPLLEQDGVTAQMQMDRPLPPLLADRVLLEQVLANLIRNACEAMRALPTGQRQLTIRATHHDSLVDLCVLDTGPGVSADAADKLFDAFVSTKPEGLGLGLAICRSIVEAHQGRIWVESADPCGAAFHFTIPAGEAPPIDQALVGGSRSSDVASRRAAALAGQETYYED